MNSLWSFIARQNNRQRLRLIGGCVIAVAGGLWAVVTYVWPSYEPAKIVCAQQGSIGAGRDAIGNTTNTNSGGAGAGAGATSCANAAKP